MKKYGFIGLGSQGGPMAQRMIDAGLPTVLWARRAEALEPYASSGAEVAASVAELGAQVQYVAICVVDDAGVQQVCDQLMSAMAPGGCIVIHSTVHPDLCKRLAIQAAENELELIDAPVSGGGQGATAGTLTVMVGGDPQVVAAARPVFETFAGLIIHLGGVGAGQHAKLVNNAIMAANLAIAYHGLNAAKALGIDRQAFVELVKVSTGRSFSFDVGSRITNVGDWSHGAKLLAKDVGLLGETLGGDNGDYEAIRRTAHGFLDLALKS